MSDKMMDMSTDLLGIYNMANNHKLSFANQGQALSGYSELAEYRGIIKKYLLENEEDKDK